MQLTWIAEKIREWTDPERELPEDAVDLDDLLTLVSVRGSGGEATARQPAVRGGARPGRLGPRGTTGRRAWSRSATNL